MVFVVLVSLFLVAFFDTLRRLGNRRVRFEQRVVRLSGLRGSFRCVGTVRNVGMNVAHEIEIGGSEHVCIRVETNSQHLPRPRQIHTCNDIG